jgi:hypothetical protein
MVGVLKSESRGVSNRCDPFGIRSKQVRDERDITGLEGLPGGDDNL